MDIILEGPDNAGKSTLAQILADELNMTVRHSGGPSKYPGEVNHRAQQYNTDMDSFIYDRHPCVSQNLYVAAFQNGGELIEEKHLINFYDNAPLIIYCRSLGDLGGHVPSEHADEEHDKKVAENYDRLCRLYDEWALKNAKLLYRIGDSIETVIDLIRGVINNGK